jgi:hypothetical protein
VLSDFLFRFWGPININIRCRHCGSTQSQSCDGFLMTRCIYCERWQNADIHGGLIEGDIWQKSLAWVEEKAENLIQKIRSMKSEKSNSISTGK